MRNTIKLKWRIKTEMSNNCSIFYLEWYGNYLFLTLIFTYSSVMDNSGKFKKLHWQVHIASYLLNVNLYTWLLVENKFIQLLESLVASTLNMSSALSTRPFSQFWICIHLEILIFKPMKTVSLKYHIWGYHVHDVKFQLLE